jgi:hypothetical protein
LANEAETEARGRDGSASAPLTKTRNKRIKRGHNVSILTFEKNSTCQENSLSLFSSPFHIVEQFSGKKHVTDKHAKLANSACSFFPLDVQFHPLSIMLD